MKLPKKIEKLYRLIMLSPNFDRRRHFSRRIFISLLMLMCKGCVYKDGFTMSNYKL